MEGPLNEITEFAMTRPIVKPKLGGFSITDEPAGAFLTNIMVFLWACPDRRFLIVASKEGGYFFLKVLAHMLFGSRRSSQTLLASRALLRLRLCIIPNPLRCFGLVDQLIA